MRVAVLTDSIDADAPGFSSYAMNLSRALIEALPGSVTLVHRGPHPFYEGLPNAVPDLRSVPLPRRLRRQWSLPRWLDERGYDLVHDTYHFGPFLRGSRFARVLTIGDLTPIVSTGAPLSSKLAHRILLPAIARRADHIVTFSEHSRRDIERILHVPPGRITVTPLAASASFRPHPPASVEAARARLGLPRCYLLFVGSIEPRKNVPALIRAFAHAGSSMQGVSLLLVGRRSWGLPGLDALIHDLGLSGRVLRRTDIDHDDLPLVYNGAIALAYPSLYEGFGLPALEAMQCGVPVVTSRASSLPEVVGDDAILVDQHSVPSIAEGLIEIVCNGELRRRLIEGGLARAERFSWKRCAELTISAYETAMQDQAAR
ncbi:MAG: glycosyltransferase family 4 protein [Chloroflexi bacterium]|nr:glycosyltransferase family 4 protein [Chloroflexota bacterium]